MEDIAIYAPGNSSLLIYLFFVFSSTTRESSSNTLPPALTDNPSKVDLANLSISPLPLLTQCLGDEAFNISAFFPYPKCDLGLGKTNSISALTGRFNAPLL